LAKMTGRFATDNVRDARQFHTRRPTVLRAAQQVDALRAPVTDAGIDLLHQVEAVESAIDIT